ncbi:hypothetical protein ABZS76_03465 [Streptomyces sp. NPDC005562]|uniref:hypothetical protein n=1 Tax=unclassified Streptomyces TaxID=2593676 RepID=UPI0033A8F431
MPASERDVPPRSPRLPGPSGAPEPSQLSMSDLLASCAAATAVSTPPRAPSGAQPCAPSGEDTTAGERRLHR